MNILITGSPGIGKTTLIKEIARTVERSGGFYTEEIRIHGRRTGFKIITLGGKEGVLSGVDIVSRHRAGKYGVDVEGFEKMALPAIEEALRTSKVIIIDEIGPMELFSKKFKGAVKQALDLPKPVVATIKLKGSGFVKNIKSRNDIILFNLDQDDREDVLKAVLREVGK